MSKEYTRLIAVLGNVPSHGPYLYFDDFEHLLKWTKFAGEGDSIFELDPTVAYSQNQCLYIKSRTTNAAEDDVIGAHIYTYLSPSLKLNQSIHFKCPDFTKTKTIIFYFIHYDGTYAHSAAVQFLPNTPKWQYRDINGDFQDIPLSAYSLHYNAWHRLQLEVNHNTHKYVSMTINHLHFDLFDLNYLLNPDDSTPTCFYSIINFSTIGAAPGELRIDDFLLHEL